VQGSERHNERQLLEQIASGDQSAFEQLFNDWYARLVVFAESFSVSRPEAEDIVSEAFVRFWDVRANFPTLAQIKTWLYTVTRNDCLMALRRDKRHPRSLPTDLPEQTTEDFAEVERARAELFALLEHEIRQLPDNYREVILLTYQEGLSSAQIAQRLGITVTNVTSRRARAIQLLRLALIQRLPAWAGLSIVELLQQIFARP
jgi:RNA polymerase sigma-70 factor (ECF subfamily)